MSSTETTIGPGTYKSKRNVRDARTLGVVCVATNSEIEDPTRNKVVLYLPSLPGRGAKSPNPVLVMPLHVFEREMVRCNEYCLPVARSGLFQYGDPVAGIYKDLEDGKEYELWFVARDAVTFRPLCVYQSLETKIVWVCQLKTFKGNTPRFTYLRETPRKEVHGS